MGMGMHKIIGQMGKIDPRYLWKTIILEKWFSVI